MKNMCFQQETYVYDLAFFVSSWEHRDMKNALDTYRVENSLTYEELAEAAECKSRGAVYSHCKGTRNISAESAMKYSRTLGIPLSDLRPDLWPSQCPPDFTLNIYPSAVPTPQEQRP